ncbi:lon protease 2-like [Dioscorea cayenensis subsp. rotundata]|uniref:Lon protease 2-like n=1 Tax=Dioscorea cayennensis subsp. rotundata TaxID=55577 RepID=A0AB40D364_DIOCR|nr:lon protease 2-like [Dioscorea cayenensis subsp. rotundata]
MALVPQILPYPPLLRQAAATAAATALPFPLSKPLSPPSPSRTALFSSPQDRRHRLSIPLRCSSSDPGGTSGDDLVELPLFPLPLVLFPGAILPLQIFEFRYRIMMHTLLQTDLRFGVIFSESGTIADVGCVGEIVKHERLVDDRFFLICKGQERFRVSGIVRTRPFLVARVSWLEDRPPPQGDDDVEALASEVETHMRDVIRISNRLNGKPEKEGGMDLRRNLFPTPFSFFVGSTFEGAPREQQALLELEDTAARLKRERDTLRNTLNYLTAASAVKDAFPSSPSSSS